MALLPNVREDLFFFRTVVSTRTIVGIQAWKTHIKTRDCLKSIRKGKRGRGFECNGDVSTGTIADYNLRGLSDRRREGF